MVRNSESSPCFAGLELESSLFRLEGSGLEFGLEVGDLNTSLLPAFLGLT